MEMLGELLVEQEHYLSCVLLARKCPFAHGVTKGHVRILAGRRGLTYPGVIPISTVGLQT